MSPAARSEASRVDDDAPVVLHVMQSAGIGGAERHLLALLPSLRARGWDVRFFGFTTTGGSAFADALAATGVPVDLNGASRTRSLTVTRALRRAIRAQRPRIAHSHLLYADVHTQLARIGLQVRTVRTIHVGPDFIPEGLARRVYGWAGSRTDRTITISEHMAKLTPQLGFAPSDRVRVVRIGVDPSSWLPRDGDRARTRAELGARDGDVIVACTSRLIEGKGQDTLIRAVADARNSNPALRLVLAGAGPDEDRLQRLAKDVLPDGAYRFTGFVDDPRTILWASDVFVLPTHTELGEGFGMSALEAAAARVPVIAADHPPLRELFVSGATALVVPPGDVPGLGAAILALAGDPALGGRLAAAAAERVAADYSHEAMVGATEAIYRELIGRDP